MFTPTNHSTLQSDISFVMSGPSESAHSVPTMTCSSQVASLKGPRRAYKQVLAKLRAGFTTFKLKTKKAKESTTGGQLAPVEADASGEKFGRPTRDIFLPDAYYGWEHVAIVSARFITTLFDFPSTLPSTSLENEYPDLAKFIAYALFLCQFDSEVNDYAMCLLWRLKVEHPGIRLTHGHGMYLAVLSLAERMTGHEDCSLEDWAMVGQWIFSAEQLEMYQQCLGGLLLWKLEFNTEDMARIVEHVQCGRQPDVEPISFPAEYDDDCAESIRPISTSSSLSTCTIPSTWSLCSMHGWDESTRKDSVMMAAPGEKGNTNPYADTESQRNLAALNVLETPNSSFNSFDS